MSPVSRLHRLKSTEEAAQRATKMLGTSDYTRLDLQNFPSQSTRTSDGEQIEATLTPMQPEAQTMQGCCVVAVTSFGTVRGHSEGFRGI